VQVVGNHNGGAAGQSRRYKINLEVLATGVTDDTGDKLSRVTNQVLTGDMGDTLTVIKSNHQDQKKLATQDEPSPEKSIWGTGLALLTRKGIPDKQARSVLGKLRKQVGDVTMMELLSEAQRIDVSEPIAWLTKAASSRARPRAGPPRPAINAQFTGTIHYEGTPDEQLPESLRNRAAA
jgi:hypothetical protein